MPSGDLWGDLQRSVGEPVPGLVTLPVTAPAVRAVATWAGVAEVWPARWTAAASATCGVAIEVPEPALFGARTVTTSARGCKRIGSPAGVAQES